ncbi:MAG: rhodanese-like domain-containing protein [Candidatus Saccharibacteria bacterium]|nr:rhodanese-like domain-containing protein [Candidatus Saccharibacteria bacterium]
MSAKAIIIDTREPSEFARSHVEGAINIPPADFMSGEFKAILKDITKDTPIIVYCVSGARSNTCSMFLADAGFSNVTNGVNEHHVRKLLA